MTNDFFRTVDAIRYEGPHTGNALAYRYYDPPRLVLGRSMEEHLRFAVCFWHSFGWAGADMFGADLFERPWFDLADPLTAAHRKVDCAFELFAKLGVPFFTFHDRDVATEQGSWRETNELLDRVVERIEQRMESSGVRLLWATANLFSHPRYAAGAATSPDPEVFACAAAQVHKAIAVTHRLGGANYVLWGGREGYDTLLNTDLGRELEQLGRFLHLVVEHKHKIGFAGTLLIEPKPMEPTKHQYDFDAAAVYAFLQRFGLEREIKLNIEVNHATLAGHSFEHELAYAAAHGLLGSVDINRGDPQLGWDTDQFPNSADELTPALYAILQAGGLGSGGFNFDAKLRRQSVDADDLFHAHIGGIDTVARALLRAAELVESGELAGAVAARYRAWEGDLGRSVLDGELSLSELAAIAESRNLNPRISSGRQELLENLVARTGG